MNIAINIDADNLLKFLASMPEKLESALNRGISVAALLIERESKVRTPVDTGRLRASIHTIHKRLRSEVGTNTNYAVYVHEGTKFMKPRPFMRDGVRAAESDIRSIISSEVTRALT